MPHIMRMLSVAGITALLLAACALPSPPSGPVGAMPVARHATSTPGHRTLPGPARIRKDPFPGYQPLWPAGWAGFITPARDRGVVLKSPDIAENGAVVPVGVATFGRTGVRPRMTAVDIYTCDRLRPVARYRYPAGVFAMKVRIKLRRSANIIAVATLDDGTRVHAVKQSKVTYGGCGGGAPEPEVTPPPGPPEAVYWQRSTLPVNAVRLTAEGSALPIESYRADVRIDGFRARVVLDVVFRSTYQWARTGKFQLRLPEGSAPYYVAFGDTVLQDEEAAPLSTVLSEAIGLPAASLDFDRAPTNDALKEAVMVERQRASTAFWNTVYRNIDPALIEWRGSGIFALDVFPLRYRQTHRIVLAYDVDLDAGPGGQRRYRFTGPEGVPDSRLYVHLPADSEAAPRDIPPAQDMARVGDHRVLSYRPRAGERLDFHVRPANGLYLYKAGTATGDYFAAEVPLDLPLLGATQAADAAVFVLDTSLSSRPESFNEYVALTEAILTRNSDRIRRFAVLFFDVGTHWWQPLFLDNTAENRHALGETLRQVSLLGASDLSRALSEAAAPADLEVGAIGQWDVFLMTDGRHNWGDPRLSDLHRQLAGSAVQHLNIYTTQPGEDVAHLRSLAETRHGGLYVLSHPQQVPSAARAHRQRAWQLERIEVPGAEDVLVAGAQGDYLPNQRLRVSGRGRPDGELRFYFRSGKRHLVVRHGLRSGLESDLTPRIFGEMAVPYLEDVRKDTGTARFFAGHFRVPRASMSLLMLARDADYRRYGINRLRKFAAGVRRARLGKVVLQQTPPLRPGTRMRMDFDDAPLALPGPGLIIPCDAWPGMFRLLSEMRWRWRIDRHEPLFLPDSALRSISMPILDPRDAQSVAEEFLHRAGTLDGQQDYLSLRLLSSGVEVAPRDPVLFQRVVAGLLKRDFSDDAWWLTYRHLQDGGGSPAFYLVAASVLAHRGEQQAALLFYEMALADGETRQGAERRVLADYRDLLVAVYGREPSDAAIQRRMVAVERRLTELE